MSTVAVVIDLDAPAPTARPRPRRDWAGIVKPAFVAALLLLVAGGAAPPVRAGRAIQVAGNDGIAASGFLLTDTALYSSRMTGAVTPGVDDPGAEGLGQDQAEIQAIPVTPGGPRWTAEVTVTDPILLSRNAAGTTIMVTPVDGGHTTFLDARTGRELWKTPEYALTRMLGDRVAVWSSMDDPPAGELRMIEAGTGRTIWQRHKVVATSLYGDAANLVTVDWDGLATVFATAGGAVLTPARPLGLDQVEWGSGLPFGSPGQTTIDGTMYWRAQSYVAAFRLPDLSPLWRTEVSQPQAVSPCGALVCVSSESGVTALDPATGAVRWAGARWRWITPDGYAVAGDLEAARLDPATGEIVDRLGRGGPIGDLMLRFDRNRTWVLSLGDGRVLGVLPDLIFASSCEAAGELLACPMAGQTVTVWRIPR